MRRALKFRAEFRPSPELQGSVEIHGSGTVPAKMSTAIGRRAYLMEHLHARSGLTHHMLGQHQLSKQV